MTYSPKQNRKRAWMRFCDCINTIRVSGNSDKIDKAKKEANILWSLYEDHFRTQTPQPLNYFLK